MPPNSSLPESNTSLTYTTPCSPPHLTHTPVPIPSPNEVLIKVHAAAINPVDIQVWSSPLLGWLTGKKEKGIGRDYSGVIVAVGEEVKKQGKWEAGDEVFGLYNNLTAEGTFTHYLLLSPSTSPLAKKPPSLPHSSASAIPLVALTAYACLSWLPSTPRTPTHPYRIIISGASGGVGTLCVQLAKRLHASHITAICSSRNASFVRSLGADTVLDYTSQNIREALLESVEKEGAGYDLYVDCVGGTDVFAYWTGLLRREGAYVTIVGDKTERTVVGGPLTYFTHPRQVLRFLRGWLVGPRYASVMLWDKSECLEQVAGLVERGEVRVVVQDVVKGILDEGMYEEAWERVKGEMVGGRVRGKIVVDVSS
ncbi:hypothetical protein COCCADRAFT_80522 [Bipolaris zeicola 26-R-13]|uniref:Enoyl reductase (ER) domain-containing protein n=1 Tax=Cochliobolus carbonum (strain 26-R-13) TaxID=930089 RepID=W6YNZ0_COCC2|nr:uncharacterized protein COCCADRAFT_80522 [Bipolaris zeicola 26-R-13]EUC39365.1 hypothetical protein COCCADRAFT_80522 [Bipolaris zeicola 26-R-13]